jgi:hypothetical protein
MMFHLFSDTVINMKKVGVVQISLNAVMRAIQFVTRVVGRGDNCTF